MSFVVQRFCNVIHRSIFGHSTEFYWVLPSFFFSFSFAALGTDLFVFFLPDFCCELFLAGAERRSSLDGRRATTVATAATRRANERPRKFDDEPRRLIRRRGARRPTQMSRTPPTRRYARRRRRRRRRRRKKKKGARYFYTADRRCGDARPSTHLPSPGPTTKTR